MSAETFPTLQSPLLRRLRLLSGQVLWCYIALHFVSHALGSMSLDAAEAALKLAAAVGLPLLAAGGFWVMTRELADVAKAAAAPRALLDVIHPQQLALLRERLRGDYLMLVAAVLVSRTCFVWRRAREAPPCKGPLRDDGAVHRR